MRASILIVVSALSCLLTACMFKQVHEQDLIGKYRADLPDGGVEFLELFPQGVCVQDIRLKDGTSYKAHGTWQYDQERGRVFFKRIREALTPMREPNPKLANPPGDETIGTPVSHSLFGNVTIVLHEGIDYEKQR